MRDWLKPEKTNLTHKEFGEEIFLLFHHADEAAKEYELAAKARGKKPGIRYANPSPEHRVKYQAEDDLIAAHERRAAAHREQAEAQTEIIGQVDVRFTGEITKAEEVWIGTPGLIGGHSEHRPYNLDLHGSKQTIWFSTNKDMFGFSVVGHLEYNGGDATFNPKKVTLEYLHPKVS